MDAEHLVLDDSGQRQEVEDLGAVPPHVHAAVLPQTLVVEAVHLRDLSALVVAADEGDAVGVAHLVVRHAQPVKPHYKRSVKPHYKRSFKPHYKRSVKPHYKRSVKPHSKRSVKPHYQRSVKPHYKRSVKPQYKRSNRQLTLAPHTAAVRTPPIDKPTLHIRQIRQAA